MKDQLDEIYKRYHQNISLRIDGKFRIFIDNGNNNYERLNVEKVKQTMTEVVKTPTVVDAMVMPDSCPTETTSKYFG